MSAPLRVTCSALALLASFSVSAVHATTVTPARGAPYAGLRPSGTVTPLAIAAAGERTYVADFDADRVVALTRAGLPILTWGGTGSEPGRFRGPAGIAVGPDGSVFVTDLYNHRVQRFSPDGELLASWVAGAENAAPFGIAVDRAGRVYVTDLEAGTVLTWSSDGAALGSWGGPGVLSEPWGIAVDAVGDVYVADHGHHRVQRFSSDGVAVGGWGEIGTGDGELLGPMGIAVGRDGSIYVSDLAGGRVRRFTRDGGLVALWRGESRVARAAALAIDERGDLVLADPLRGQVARIPDASTTGADAAPAAFALMPVSRPIGEGPFTLEMAIPAAGRLTLEVFGIDGRRVHTVAGEPCEPGLHRMTWDARSDDGRRAPAGMYFVRAQFEDGVRRVVRSARVVVLR